MFGQGFFAKRAVVRGLFVGLVLGGLYTASNVLTPGSTVLRLHTETVTDMEDDRKLVGFADNVFFGEVVKQVSDTGGGTVEEPEIPETQFSVKVLEVVKGNVSGVITVNQEGGHRNLEGQDELVIREGDRLVEAGNTYLFATRVYPETGWHTLIPVYGDLEVTASTKSAVRNRFVNAAATQIPFDPNQ